MSEPRIGGAATFPAFCAVMAHDIRNPLAALTANLHFLRDTLEDVDARAQDGIADSITLCGVLERLAKNLQDLALPEGVTANRSSFELGVLVRDLVRRAQHYAAMSELAIDVAGGEVMAFADRGLVQRALENALADAIEHAPRGSRVQVLVAREGAEAQVTLLDERRFLPPPGDAQGADAAWLRDRYGRGLSLLAAELGLRATGGDLEIRGMPGACRLRLVVPAFA